MKIPQKPFKEGDEKNESVRLSVNNTTIGRNVITIERAMLLTLKRLVEGDYVWTLVAR